MKVKQEKDRNIPSQTPMNHLWLSLQASRHIDVLTFNKSTKWTGWKATGILESYYLTPYSFLTSAPSHKINNSWLDFPGCRCNSSLCVPSCLLLPPQAFPEGQPVGGWGDDLIVLGLHRFGHGDVHLVHPLSYNSCLPSLPCHCCPGVLREWKVLFLFACW